MESTGSPHGVYRDSSQSPQGFLMESMDYFCGVHETLLRSPHGVHKSM